MWCLYFLLWLWLPCFLLVFFSAEKNRLGRTRFGRKVKPGKYSWLSG
jgi:hypothetical protein